MSGKYIPHVVHTCTCMYMQTKAITLHDELFSVENGFLTPTFKAKRPAVKNAFMESFVRMYNALENN